MDDYHRLRFEGEDNDETTLFFLRAHPLTNLGWVTLVLIFLAVPIVFQALLTDNFIAINLSARNIFLAVTTWYLVVAGFSFQRFLSWYFNIYILTNKRIVDIDFYGLFYRSVSQASLSNVEDITYTKGGLFQNFFDYGNLTLQTAGTAPNFEFTSIPDPEGNQQKIIDLVTRYKKGQLK